MTEKGCCVNCRLRRKLRIVGQVVENEACSSCGSRMFEFFRGADKKEWKPGRPGSVLREGGGKNV
jgi:hypothetical protein